jgi:hypothetical protein
MAKTNAKKEEPAQIGHNITGFHAEIVAAHERITDLVKQRKAINEEIAAERSKLETKGLTRKGQAAVLSFFNLSPEDRKAFDNTVVSMRDALGVPLKGAQLDLNIEQAQGVDAQKEGE